MKAAELKELVVRLQEVNILLSDLYKERGALQAKLFADPDTGPALTSGGEVETPEGYGIKAERKDPETCSEWERKNGMKSPSGHILKLKLTIPKGPKP
jgi:hypothetical protein